MIWRQLAPSKQLLWLACTYFLLLLYCRNTEVATIENLREKSELTDHQIISLTGRRDADYLPATLVFEGSSSNLRMDLNFRIGVPTRLESGQYRWERKDGILGGLVRARSVIFLGGQSDNPNLGGVFELLSAEGVPIYKVTLPTSEVRPSTPETFQVAPSH